VPSDARSAAADRPSFGSAGRHLDVLPGRYFVRVHPDAIRPHVPVHERAASGPARMAFTQATSLALPDEVAEPLEYLEANSGLRNVRPLFSDSGRRQLAAASVPRSTRSRLAVAAAVATQDDDELAGLAIAEVDPRASVETIEHAASARAIDFIEPVPARWLAVEPRPASVAVEPTRNLQWGLRAIHFFDAKLPECADRRVGVLDTGIDMKHPDLENVAIDYEFGDMRAEDVVGHGTHVAGTIAAEANNAVGIAGVAPCSMAVWKVFPDRTYRGEFYVDPDLLADALREAEDADLSALNLSFGGTVASRTEQRLISRLHDRGVAVVAAMGNSYNDGDPTMYPAAYEDVLAVGALAENRERSDFSCTGAHIDICAPGSNILSTVPRRRSSHRAERLYACWSGTSMAAPHVSAAAALVAARFPTLDVGSVVRRLTGRATKLDAMGERATTREYGAGLLNLARALS
jgi:hypothetical protein